MKNKLLFLIALIGLVLNTSCLKKQNLADENLGEPFEAAALTKSVSEGIGRYSYDDIKKNEFTSFVVTQKIQDASLTPLEQQDMTVKNFENTDEYMKIDSLVTKITFSGGQSSQSSREWTDQFNKVSSKTTTNPSELSPLDANVERPVYLFFTLENVALDSCSSSSTNPQTCYHLQVTDVKYPVPPAAAVDSGCTDTDNCFVDARRIEFDALYTSQLDSNGKPLRVHTTMIVSKNVPFLSKMLQLCQRRLYTTTSQQKVLAEICYTVTNYAFGDK